MSNQRCNCHWCQKNISNPEATVIRLNFLVDVFYLMFKNMFSIPEETVIDIREKFKKAMSDFISNGDKQESKVLETIINESFYAIGLNGNMKPFEICSKCGEIDQAIANAFKALQIDISISQTPILSKILTAEMFVNNELNISELPEEVMKMYHHSPINSLTDVLSELTSSLGIEVELPKQQPRTVH